MEDSILKYVTKESFDAFLKKSENSKDFFYQTLLKQPTGLIRSSVD